MRFDLDIPAQLSAALAPDLFLIGAALVLLLWASWRPESEEHQRRVGIASIVVCVITAGILVWFLAADASAGPGIIAVDAFRWTVDLLFVLATVIALALSLDYNRRERIHIGESHVLLLLGTSGMMLLAAARDLTMVFLGIELMSVAVYVLAGLDRRSARAAEAALKYFLLGAFATGFLLYGIALIYGATGTTNFAQIAERIASSGVAGSPMLLIGMALLLVGFGFKVAAVPFHMYTPDVYEGAPTPYTAYMAAAVKAGAFAAFLRVWLEAFSAEIAAWHLAMWWLAVITMVVGNLVALAQNNIKRLLAYSSIAHAGYILVGVVVGTPAGTSAFLFYLLAYTLATMGAFAVVTALGQAGERNLQLQDYAGLWRTRPGLAVAMAVFMLALLGFPVVGGMGFFAKWFILEAALRAPSPQTILAVVVVLTSVISAGYYLAVVVYMFMRARSADAPAPAAVPGLTRLVIAGAAAALLVFGIFPDPIVSLARGGALDTSIGTVAGPPVDGSPRP